jgi:E3 ubiquitin-protein ligase RNF13
VLSFSPITWALVEHEGRGPSVETIFEHAPAGFGPLGTPNITLTLASVNIKDAHGCLPEEPACLNQPHINGTILLIKRGASDPKKSFSFIEKVRQGQKQGAVAVIVYNNETYSTSENLITMAPPETGNSGDIKIPSAFVTYKTGKSLVDKIESSEGEVYLSLDDRGETEPSYPPNSIDYLPLGWTAVMMINLLCGMVLISCLKHACTAVSGYAQRSRRMLRIPRRRYGDEDIHNDSCVICLDDFESDSSIKVLPCNHGFHVDCIDPWLRSRSDLCPLCKTSILVPTEQHPRCSRASCMECIAFSREFCYYSIEFCRHSRRQWQYGGDGTQLEGLSGTIVSDDFDNNEGQLDDASTGLDQEDSIEVDLVAI